MTRPNDLEQRVRELLAERGEAQLPTIDTSRELRRLLARFPGERRRWRVRMAGAVVGVCAAVAGLVLAGLALPVGTGGGQTLPAGGLRLPRPALTVDAEKVPAGALQWTSGKRFTAPAPGLVVGTTLWVDDVHETTLTRIDLQTHQVLGTVTYGTAQPVLTGPLVRAGAVLLLPIDDSSGGAAGRLLRFSVATGRELPAIRVDRAGAGVVAAGHVFAQIGPSTVGLVDAVAGRVVRSFSMPVGRGLVAADGLIWAWDGRSESLVGADPATGRQARQFHLPGCTDLPFQADGAHAILLGGPNGLVRIDLGTGAVTATTNFVPLGLVADIRGGLWAVDGAQLAELDGSTLRMIKRYDVGRADAVQIAGAALLVADNASGHVRSFSWERLAR